MAAPIASNIDKTFSGVALETGTIETEFKTNVTSVSATFALANTLSIAVPVGISDDVMVISRSHGLLMDAIRGEL
jgi:phosphohistidine swiveling domain-containing protein